MKKGTKVAWTTASDVHETGEVIDNNLEEYVLVSVDAPPGEEHRVIYCAVSWLTKIGEEVL